MWVWRCFFHALQIGSALGYSHVLAGSPCERLEGFFARPNIIDSAVHLTALGDVRRVDPIRVVALLTAFKGNLGLLYLFDSFQVISIREVLLIFVFEFVRGFVVFDGLRTLRVW